MIILEMSILAVYQSCVILIQSSFKGQYDTAWTRLCKITTKQVALPAVWNQNRKMQAPYRLPDETSKYNVAQN